MRIHFLKTIWSDMIVLEHQNEVALIDTGFAEQYEELAAYLKELGVKKISFILLTHFHRDHYGSIPNLLENFSVEKVYLKEYSGLDSTTAWGTVADDAYRAEEMKKFHAMQKLIQEKSKLVPVEGVKEIFFAETVLQLFSTENTIRQIYEDPAFPETYHKITCSENQNSLAVFMKVNGKNLFFGGDIMDAPSTHPLANFVNTQIAKQIDEQIDIYKVPHHGTVHTGTMEALAIYRPKEAVITNENNYLLENSDVYDNLKKADPDVQIMLTEEKHVVFQV